MTLSDQMLAGLAQQLGQNYSSLESAFLGGRLFFTVNEEEGPVTRTLLLAPGRPRLFSGHLRPEGPDAEKVPFLSLEATFLQLQEFFSGSLDLSHPSNQTFAFEGNSESLYQAIGRCL